MCRATDDDKKPTVAQNATKNRRPKRLRQEGLLELQRREKARRKFHSRHAKKEKEDGEEGNLMAFLPTLGIVVVVAFAVMAKMGFRGRPTTAGIDLGTTNSVICVQSPSESVGDIVCIPDPYSKSPIIPSVVSFKDMPLITPKTKPKPKRKVPNPRAIIVGEEAKERIESHPKSTFYHAKRVLGRTFDTHAVSELQHEVEFDLTREDDDTVLFESPESGRLSPSQIGSYVVSHLIEIAASYNYAYSSLTSAVIAVPAEFSAEQRIATVDAFKLAGIKVTRILEEPTAAALAYGLDQKEGVEHILVYDFGGGTLDISVLRVSPDGFVDVIGSSGDSELGGVDFDIHVADYLLEKEKDALLEGDGHTKCDVEVGTHLCTETSIRTMSERMKIKLSQLQDGSEDQKVSVQEECLTISKDQAIGDNDVCKSLVSHTINLTLEEYDQSVSELYDRSVLPIRDVLKDLDMKPEDIDEVVMVGGTTRMPQIRKLIKEEFSGVIEDLNTQIDPDLTVAYGAASVID